MSKLFKEASSWAGVWKMYGQSGQLPTKVLADQEALSQIERTNCAPTVLLAHLALGSFLRPCYVLPLQFRFFIYIIHFVIEQGPLKLQWSLDRTWILDETNSPPKLADFKIRILLTPKSRNWITWPYHWQYRLCAGLKVRSFISLVRNQFQAWQPQVTSNIDSKWNVGKGIFIVQFPNEQNK